MTVRYVYPTVTAQGFGNNIFALARAHLIAQTCCMSYLQPIWPYCVHVRPPKRNGYAYYFPTPLRDKLTFKLSVLQRKIQHKLRAELWPVIYFTKTEYAQTKAIDAGEACKNFLQLRGLDDPDKSTVVVIGKGMWGRYAAIRRAAPWLVEQLLSHADTRKRLGEIIHQTEGRLRVGIHIRMTDFISRENATPIQDGERGVRLPLEWYARICRKIRETCDCHFILLTDGTGEELSSFLQEFDPIHTIGEPYQDLLGILLMSRSDLVICSNSTFSRFGVFLNDKPYIWPADTLTKDFSQKFGYLWKDGRNPKPATDSSDRDAIRRCFALHTDFSVLPAGLKRYLESDGTLPIEMPDDILYEEPVYLL